MKKITFSFLFAFAAFSSVFSQHLEIIRTGPAGNHSVNDSTLVLYGLVSDSMLTQSLYVINSSGSAMTVNAKREVVSEVAGSQSEICWAGTCYSPSTTVSPSTETLTPPHDTSNNANTFSGDYLPHGYKGTTTINYEFWDVSNSTDSAHITVKFIITLTGIASIKDGGINFSAPYPNPANSAVNFNYSLTNVESANLKIFNLLGDCIQTLPLSPLKNKTTVDVQSIPSGVYVCEIVAEGCQPVYQKLIVSH